ncbi:MAG: pilus assembly protein PilO [Thermomicrobiales bacterium]|jgi:type IV pilus assembly protein PilO|nr:MAG: pilus assembly protein PilO [Thermomicrobiales bacterium]
MNAQVVNSVRGFDITKLADDFRSLDPKDPGMWPLVPKIVVLIVLLALVIAAGWWFDWKDQLQDLTGKQEQEVKLKEEWLGKKRQAVNLDEHRKQLAEIDRQFGALLKQLPNKSEMESLLVDINQAGLGRGLQFELFKPGVESTKDFYAELPITVKLTGGYHDLGSFAGDVAKMPRIVTLNNVVIEGDPKTSALKMDAIATTYRYLDEEELAKQRKDKAAAAKSKGKGAGK